MSGHFGDEVTVVVRKVMCVYCLFFTQKTAYEMRISDWGSDVCSSALVHVERPIEGEYESEFFEPSYQQSQPVTIDNKRGYAFVGGPTGVQVVDVITKDEKLIEGEGAQLEEKVLFTIPTAGTVRDIVTRSDLGAAYVATDAGVMIIDSSEEHTSELKSRMSIP